ncbi:MAG: hypothetical protein M0Q14_10720 [Tissierellaceae bacterium]|nr:hypothetical protein [Tissierellaceae bacterium]
MARISPNKVIKATVIDKDFNLNELEGLEEEIAEDTKKKKAKVDNMVRAEQLAKELGTDGPKLRAWLRKQYPNRPKGAAWKWEKDSEELQEVIDGYIAYKEAPKKEKPKKKNKESKPVKAVAVEEDDEVMDIDFDDDDFGIDL